ncbi:MAG TPA: AAA family ATPase [Steroidobacteraceae bacterium]|jgi:chromosome segregation ATPase
MKLREIELRNWRGLNQSLAVLSPRLNLILGPNESGKSRIFQALQFALFETYKGTSQRKQALQSWASSESPFVRVAFTNGEVDYELHKQFLKGASVQLSGGGKTLRGEDAEEALRQILGTRPPGNRGAGLDDMGIWPLIMVSQGESRAPVQEHLNEDGRGRLHDRLSREIGVAAISPTGQRVMALAEEEYHRYFTATGQEGKGLRDARGLLREAEERLEAATESLQRQEKTAQALASNRVGLVELEARRARAQVEADTARNRAEATQVAGRSVATAQGVVNTSVQKASSALDALNTRQQADATIQRLAEDLARLETEIAQRSGLQHELEQSARAAEQRFGEVERQQRRLELSGAAQELQERVARLEQLDVAIAKARALRARLPVIDDANLARLQQLDQVSRAASAKLQGAAVNIVVHLKQDALIDGMLRAAGETIQIHVVDNQRISIGDLADVEIRPGGGELGRLRTADADAAAELEAALRAAGVESLSRAVEVHDERVTCEQQITELGKQVKATSSKSLAQLREDLAVCVAELERLGPAGATALEALTLVTSERNAAVAALAEFRENMIELRTQHQTLRGERERFVRQYAERPTAAQLQAALDAAVVERERATRVLIEARREFADLGGSEVQADARRLAIAADSLAARARDLRSEGDQLQGELRTLMLSGHYESKEEAAAAVEQAKSDLERLERQAAAARRLWETLSTERRRVVEKLTAPVTLRVRPYLQELFPGCGLDAGEGLGILGLQSEQLKEPFDELSGGAQEQLSLLTRIGLAEVLAAEGTLPLILDDALINTDPERIRRIQRLLFRAADNLQIILFSCHDVLFDGLGAEFVRQLGRRRH